MTFLELYGDELDQELGSADRLQLFTLARRKAAINRAHLEFVRLTDCYHIQATQVLVDNDAVITLDNIANGPIIRVKDAWITRDPLTGPNVTISGDDFQQKTETWLDRYEPGWREAASGTPRFWFTRRVTASWQLVLTPAIDIPAGDAATLFLDAVVQPPTLSLDADEPFGAVGALNGYHKALVHYAAAQLEKLRRNYTVSEFQHNLFNGYVAAFLQENEETGRLNGSQDVSFARDYLAEQSLGPMAEDPRR